MLISLSELQSIVLIFKVTAMSRYRVSVRSFPRGSATSIKASTVFVFRQCSVLSDWCIHGLIMSKISVLQFLVDLRMLTFALLLHDVIYSFSVIVCSHCYLQ